MKKTKFLLLAVAFPLSSQAAIVRIGSGDFTPEASTITFSEQPVNTTNPNYSVNTVSLGVVGVDFAGTFIGQVEAPGGTLTTTTPTAPLTLDLGSGAAFITNDGANPTSPVLSGTPRFNGSIAVLFSTPVAAVGLDGGFFDALNSTSIEAYDANGASLGIVTNDSLGIEFFGLADSSGDNVISGISFYVTGNEPAGFAIDNLTFGSAREIGGSSPIPEPGSLLALCGLMVSGLTLRTRR